MSPGFTCTMVLMRIRFHAGKVQEADQLPLFTHPHRMVAACVTDERAARDGALQTVAPNPFLAALPQIGERPANIGQTRDAAFSNGTTCDAHVLSEIRDPAP